MQVKSPLVVGRTGLLNTINHVGRFLQYLGINPFELNASKVLQHAAKQSGFDYESESMRNGLERLIQSLDQEASLDTFGKIGFKNLIERTATGRFQVEKAIHDNPRIVNKPINKPLFIIGMPRSGTTILHALLACDEATRSPLAWECLLPYPVSTPETYSDNSQLKKTQLEFNYLFKLVPDFKKKHYMEANSPQECVGINAMDFNSFQFLAQCDMPSYHDWLVNNSNKLETMKWHKRFLQYLQSGGVKSQRWLLKTPIHLMRLEQLFAVYPDAQVIMTHRHPKSVVPSAASLMSTVRSLYSKKDSVLRSGRESLEMWSDYHDRFLDARIKVKKEEQIIDLLFEDFVDGHLAVVESIYEKFGLELTDKTRQKMQHFLNNEPKNKHGKHEYSLEQFGLTENDIEKKYQRYIEYITDLKTKPLKHIYGK